MSWNIKTPGDYINGPLTVNGTTKIGATGTSYKLLVNTAVSNAGDIQLKRGGFIGFSNAADTSNSEYIYANGGALEFGIGASTIAWLTATGLGIGGNPSYKLDVVGDSRVIGDTYIFKNQAGAVESKRLIFGSAANSSAAAISSLTATANDGYLSLFTKKAGTLTEQVWIDNNGNTTVSYGNLVMGTAGKGIDFSSGSNAAGMTSELLNDYEEGTWTPTITAETGTPTSVTINSAIYTKTGRLVCVGFDFTVVDKGTASNSLRFTLPFVMSVGSQCGAFRETSNIGWMGMVTAATTSIGSLNLYNNGTPWVNSYRFQGSFTYFA